MSDNLRPWWNKKYSWNKSPKRYMLIWKKIRELSKVDIKFRRLFLDKLQKNWKTLPRFNKIKCKFKSINETNKLVKILKSKSKQQVIKSIANTLSHEYLNCMWLRFKDNPVWILQILKLN